MSIPYVSPFVIEGYGLKEEDLNEIIAIERLKDTSKRFSKTIQTIQEKFDSENKMRIIEFNELSGADANSDLFFKNLIFSYTHIFFNTINSSKDCCVVFFYAGHGKSDKTLSERILPHEFAHHFAWASEGYPFLMPQGTPRHLIPQFADCYEVGPKIGTIYIDNLFLDNNMIIIKDFFERIADFVCEGILREKGFWKGMLEEYQAMGHQDPAKKYGMLFDPKFKAAVRYARRLALRDVAEWHAILELAYPNDPNLKNRLNYDRKRVLHLNKKFGGAKHAFKKIYEISLGTNHNSFKDVRNAVTYIKEVTDLLGIDIRTKESW